MALSVPSRFTSIITRIAADGILDGDVNRIAGWVQTESAFDPWAVRYEPAFYERYVKPIAGISETEGRCRAMSWGLLQIMGQVARENGFTDHWLPALCDPETNVELACQILRLRKTATGSWDGALAAYNGGLGGNRHRPYRNQFYVDKVDQNAGRFFT